MIPKDKWKHQGLPGHFCGANLCAFRLCTDIGKYRISTVGEFTSSRNGEMLPLGLDHHYETMVFEINRRGEVKTWMEVDAVVLKLGEDIEVTRKLAKRMHDKMCMKYARKQP